MYHVLGQGIELSPGVSLEVCFHDVDVNGLVLRAYLGNRVFFSANGGHK